MRGPLRPLALVAGLILSVSVSAQPATITREQILGTPPDQMHTMLRDLLWEMVEVRDLRPKGNPKVEFSPLRLDTKVQPALVPGLCRYDSLFLMMRPAGEGRYRVRNIVVRQHFRFLEPPSKVYAASWFTGAENPGCEGLDNDRGFFEAESEQSATDGYRAFLMLQADLRSGRDLPIGCGVLRKQDCTVAAMLAIRPEDIDYVGACEEPDGLCHRIGSTRHERTLEVVLVPGTESVERARFEFLPLITTASRTEPR